MDKYKNDFLLFLEDFYSGINPNTKKIEKFQLFEFQKDIINKIESGFEFFISKSRQMHFTTLFFYYIAWKLITNEKFSIHLIINDINIGKIHLQNINNIISQICNKLDLKKIYNKSTTKNIILINDSNIKIGTSKRSFIGKKIDITIFDEASFCKDFETCYNSAVICSKKIIAYSSINNYNFFVKKSLEKNGYNYHWTQHPIYSKDYDGNNYHTSEWYRKKCLLYSDEKKIHAELNCIPIDNKEKEIVITFRIDENLNQKVKDKLLNLNVNMSNYIRDLIEKDLCN